ncbi:retrovirus-related pol polyprotein LINE-1 [Tanacetum coccineum]
MLAKMRAPRRDESFSWGKWRGQSMYVRDAGVISSALSNLQKFSNDGIFLHRFKGSHQQKNDDSSSTDDGDRRDSKSKEPLSRTNGGRLQFAVQYITFLYENLVLALESRIEAILCDGHLRSCPSGLGGVGGFRGTRGYGRVVGTRRIRVGSWNVGSLTRKLVEICNVLGRHKVDIECFQETKWKGSRMREGNGYRLWYSGFATVRNGVGVILAVGLKDKVVQVTRRNIRIMAISIIIDGETVNVIAHTLHWSGLVTRVGVSTQIDYLLVRKGDLGACKDCRAFPSEACSPQHRLVTLDVLFERQRQRRAETERPRILWKNLNGDAVETFRATFFEKLSTLWEDMATSDADQMWNTLSRSIKDAEKDFVDVTSESTRTHSTHKESWWFCEEVHTKIAAKQARIAKARERKRRDLGNIRYTKNEEGRTIMMEEDIRKRWGECGNWKEGLNSL